MLLYDSYNVRDEIGLRSVDCDIIVVIRFKCDVLSHQGITVLHIVRNLE